MAIADLIPSMNDAALANLDRNVRRLEGEAGGARRQQAAELRPLIDAELSRRLALKPTKPARVSPPRKSKAKAAPKADLEAEPETP
jgi:hypothetical protein